MLLFVEGFVEINMNRNEIENVLIDINCKIDEECDKNVNVVLPFDATTKKFVEIDKLEKLESKVCYSLFKRAFDFIASFCAFVVLAIPMCIIAIFIKLDSKGPVIYKQKRVGLYGKSFNLYKFRSMQIDAEKDGVQWASSDFDSRITRVGTFIRKSRLDELPQLVNILKGEMSIVGPRPERPVYYKAFRKYMNGFEQRLLIKPGLTGYAQIHGGYDLDPESKCKMDVMYINKRSIVLDIKIILKTIAVVFSHEGAR